MPIHSYIVVAASNMPFKIMYQTDGTEAPVGGPPTAAPADGINTGFCLDILER